MPENCVLTHAYLKTPKAAAIAGIAFSLLLLLILWLLRTSIPADPLEPGAWLATDTRAITVALNLVPFAGVAFLWFIGVLRDRLGQREDRFFASVFFGSALLFLAMLFAAAAVIGAVMLVASISEPNELISSATFRFARAVSYIIVNVYAIKMAAVFMISTSTVLIRTGIAPRWIALLGFSLAVILLIGSFFINWSIAVFPSWVFLISVYILIDNLGRNPLADGGSPVCDNPDPVAETAATSRRQPRDAGVLDPRARCHPLPLAARRSARGRSPRSAPRSAPAFASGSGSARKPVTSRVTILSTNSASSSFSGS